MKSPQNNCPDALLRASQRRVEELEKALQSSYIWGYSTGKLSELDALLEAAAVQIPAEIITRNRMIAVWEEGFREHRDWTLPSEEAGPEKELSWMLLYASQLYSARDLPKAAVRGILWKMALTASNLLSPDLDVLALSLEEYLRSTRKHPGMTLECDGHSDATRLFALAEEIGEVAACLTYDNDAETGHNSNLESEVIQVIALALAWATRYLDDGEE